MGNIITIVSGNEKVGKTTVAATVSSVLAILGIKTVCIDFSAKTDILELSLAIKLRDTGGNLETLSEKGGVLKACTKHPSIPNLYLLSASILFNPEGLKPSDVMPIFKEIRREFSFCIIDTPSVINPGFKLANADADMAIVVTTGDTPHMSDVSRSIKYAKFAKVKNVSMLINRIMPETKDTLLEVSKKITNENGTQLIGIIPDDDSVLAAMQLNLPLVLYKNTRIAASFLNVSRLLLDMYPALNNIDPGAANKFGLFGDPDLWAKSTLLNAKVEDLIAIHIIAQDLFTGNESIRNRMWLHDLLDDRNIPYYIEVGNIGGGKALSEAQIIYVEKKNAKIAYGLINKFNNPISVVHNVNDYKGGSITLRDGTPQIKCTKCDKEIDFDYHVCPYCKGEPS